MVLEMTWEEFEAEFKPISNYIDMASPNPHGGISVEDNMYMFETYGEELAFVLKRAEEHPGTVWTLVEGDDGLAFISDGYHLVNRLGYVITELPAKDGVEYVIDKEESDLEHNPD